MTDAAHRAARLIATHWRDGTRLAALPDDCRPADVAAGHAIQRALAGALSERVVGWKIAATSTNGQHHIGVDGPLVGRLFASRVHGDGARLSLRGNRMLAAECEFVFRLARDLPPRPEPYTREEVVAAVDTLHAGLELPDSRFEDFATAGEAQLVADDACAHAMVLGPAATEDWRGVDLAAHPTCLRVNGAVVTRGTGADVLGDPRDALAWIASAHAVRGEGLVAGQIVTTGVTGAPSAIQAGDRVEADLGILGRVVAELLP